MTSQDRFLELVAQHEREWGTDTYKGRPTLKQIMDAKVVVFWFPTGDELPPTLTIHKNLNEIDAYVKAMVVHSKTEMPRLRLNKVFMDKKPVRIKDIKIIFDIPRK